MFLTTFCSSIRKLSSTNVNFITMQFTDLFCYRATKEIPLQCNARVNFEFKIFFVQRHPAFHVEPMSGELNVQHYSYSMPALCIMCHCKIKIPNTEQSATTEGK